MGERETPQQDRAAQEPRAEAGRHEPGDVHQYRIVCDVCGQVGTLRVSVDPATDMPGGPVAIGEPR